MSDEHEAEAAKQNFTLGCSDRGQLGADHFSSLLGCHGAYDRARKDLKRN